MCVKLSHVKLYIINQYQGFNLSPMSIILKKKVQYMFKIIYFIWNRFLAMEFFFFFLWPEFEP